MASARGRLTRAAIAGVVLGLVSRTHVVGAADRVEFSPVRMSTELAAGERSTAAIEIRNTGTETWTPSDNVKLSYHWLRASGDLVVRDGERTELPGPVAPGDSVRLCARVVAPREPGDYLIEWEMVREGVGWFSNTNRPARLVVSVSAPGQPRASVRVLTRLVLVGVVSLAHVALTIVWLWPLFRRLAASADERLFGVVVVGLGTFVGVLHVASFTVGLSFASVLATLGVWHFFSWRMSPRLLRACTRDVPPAADGSPAPRFDAFEAGLRWTGLAVIAAIATHWFDSSIVSMAVEGTDAAHYHVPNAVNLALGANPLDFVATPHLYPMGTSVLAAWFILPLHDPLIVDLTIFPFFLLVLASLAWLFRLVTGEPGATWVPWLVLVLFATPLLQVSSLMSADLPYAAAFLALNTQLFRMWRRRLTSPLDVVLSGLATGLLLGSKATGVVSAVLLWALYGGVSLIDPQVRRQLRASLRWRALSWPAMALVLAIAAGGIWPLRNWINYGSPLAPSGLSILGLQIFPGDSIEGGRYYLSVMSDVRDQSSYGLAARTAFYLRRWLGRWFLPSMLLVLLIVVDWMYARQRRHAADRIWLALFVSVLTVIHVGLLVQSPWSSLEWTRGLSLRYALPLLLLWPFLVFVALFSDMWPWWKSRTATIAAGMGLALGACVLFAKRANRPGLPDADIASVTPALLILSVIVAVGAFGGGLTKRRTSAVAPIALALVTVWFFAWRAAVADARLRPGQVPAACGSAPEATDRYLAVYQRILDYEQHAGTRCAARRFFMAARFDAPMALQPVPYENLVYDARPRSMVERAMERDGPGTGPCDYVIASVAELQTDRGTPLIARLTNEGLIREIGPSGPYMLFSSARGSSSAR